MKKNKIPKGLDIEEIVEQEYEELDSRQKFIESLNVENNKKSTHKREPANQKKVKAYIERRKAEDADHIRREKLLKAMDKLEKQEER